MSDYNWISVKEQFPRPAPTFPVRCLVALGSAVMEARYDSAYGFMTCSPGVPTGLSPTHWQPLPDPPKHETSFERWWDGNAMVEATPDYRYVGWKEKVAMVAPLWKSTAECIWNAAVEATKKPDFVP